MTMRDGGSIVTITFFVAEARRSTRTAPAGKHDLALRAALDGVAPDASPREAAAALVAALRPARRDEAEVLVAVVPVRRVPTYAGEPA